LIIEEDMSVGGGSGSEKAAVLGTWGVCEWGAPSPFPEILSPQGLAVKK
jgi:hypothetical protein